MFGGQLVRISKVGTHAPSVFFFKKHDDRRGIGVDTRMDYNRCQQLLDDLFDFIFL